MKYLDEVGHLGEADKRTTVNLGIARVLVEPEGDVRFEGHDAAGKVWRVWIGPAGGVGGTDVWTADFDRNGRQDLLIAAYFPGNGRCIDGATIYTLMFDDLGRPVPWIAHSNSFADFRRPPLAVVDANGDGRAEMVTVSCEYSEPATSFGEDRQISGIYEAKDARWRPIQGASDGLYLAAAKRQLGPRSPGFERWLKADPTHWSDFLAGYDSRPTEQIRSLITSGAGCGGIRIEIVDGRVVEPKDDPCDILGHARAVYSDGKARKGWPYVVIDSSDGRNVFLSDPATALRNVLKMGYRFKILGDPASPDVLWVDGGAGAQPGQVAFRLRTGEPKRMKLISQELHSTGSAMFDVTLNVEQRCFMLRSNGEAPTTVVESRDCPAIAKLMLSGISGGAILVRESMAWQIVSDRNELRTFRSNDGGELYTIQFEAAAGTTGSVRGAVSFGDDWLVEWRSGPKRWLVLHSATGKPISGGMASPIDGDLFDSKDYDGLQFLKWENGKPAELITVPASAEWSRALD